MAGGKQSAKGTPAAATNFPRWGDGSMLEAVLTTEEIREGDGTPSIGSVIKNLQFWKGVLVPSHFRALDFAFWLKAVCGTLSDQQAGAGITGQAWANAVPKTGSEVAAVAAGATSVSYALVSGAAPASTEWYQIGNGPNAEVRQVTVSGVGPYTLTVAALTNAHIAGELITLVNKYGTIASSIVGAATFSYTIVTGAAPVVNDIFMIDVNNPGGTTTSEVFKATVVTGAGPYTITPDHTPLFAHGAASPAVAAFVAAGVGVQVYAHTFIPQPIRDWYTFYQQYLTTVPKYVQVSDAQMHSMTIDAQRGKALKLQFDGTGLVGQDSVSALTPSLDLSSGIFLYYGGTFNVDGSLVGTVAPFLTQVKLAYTHPHDDTMQTEQATLIDLISTLRKIQVDYEVLWQDFTQFEKTYFNATLGPDNATVGTGSIDITFFAGGNDVNNSLEIIVPNLKYIAAPLPAPKLSGKALLQKVSAVAVVSPECRFVLKCSAFQAN